MKRKKKLKTTPKRRKNNMKVIMYALLILAAVTAYFLYIIKIKNPAPPISTAPSNQSTALDSAVCDPANGPFATAITNEFFPLPVDKVLVLENPNGFKVQITVLNETEVVAGVETRVVEEREWEDETLVEMSRNYFVQALDGTVCYYGEDVDMYENDKIVSHEGAWRAGVGGNKPGIMMPAQQATGQTYQIEFAPGIATDRAEHVALENTYTTPAGTFNDILLVKETPASSKRYARGIGLIFDDGAILTSYN